MPWNMDTRLLLLTLFTVTIIAFVIFKRLTAPIAKVPGPILTALSVLPAVYQDARSNRTRWTESLHDKYGPIVRLSPSEVSVCSQASIKDVFTGAAKTGYYPKAPLFNSFQHFGARNAFSSIETDTHSWRRRIVAGAYAQTALLAKEAKTGILWRNVGSFINFIDERGAPTAEALGLQAGARSVDFFSACRYFAADNVSAHLFGPPAGALEGNGRVQKFIESSAEGPDDVITYMKIHLADLHNALVFFRRMVLRLFVSSESELPSRPRPSTKPGAQQSIDNSVWYGGSEIRDWGFKQFVALRKNVESGIQSADVDSPVAVRLAENAIQAEHAKGDELPIGLDRGVRRFALPDSVNVYYRNEGCASECMDQLLAGLDTVGDSLSYVLHVLSLPIHQREQARLRTECIALDLTREYDRPLTQSKLDAVINAQYVDAVLKETLRLYPASTTAFQREVPAGGRVLDDYYLPGGTIVGATPVMTNMVSTTFDPFGKYSVKEWHPERWIHASPEAVAEMNRRLWTFGSGGRGCIGKHLALLEMKLVIAALYARFATHNDVVSDVEKPASHCSSRNTFRDVDWFHDANGILAFEPQID